MAILTRDCPHCGIRNTAFDLKHSHPNPRDNSYWNAFASCPSCFMPLAVNVYTEGRNPSQIDGNLESARSVTHVKVFPSRRISTSPEHVPDAAAKAFVEGVENLKDGRFTSSVAMFRRAIDVGTKQFAPEIDVFKLEKRIDKLEKEGLITTALKDWAHKIRLEGNEAIHEIDEPSKQQATELMLFTELVLTYLFTLPAKVNANLAAE